MIKQQFGAVPDTLEHPDDQQTVDVWADLIGLCSRYVALLAAWIATSGSLFFSEVLGWMPCSLCWYQRILMYPLSIVIAVGLLRRDTHLHAYVLPLSIAGAGVSLYHYLLQKTTWFSPPACALGVPCTTDYINWFGFVTIPFLALTAFLIIIFTMVVSLLTRAENVEHTQRAASSARFDVDRIAVFAGIGIVITCFVAAARFI